MRTLLLLLLAAALVVAAETEIDVSVTNTSVEEATLPANGTFETSLGGEVRFLGNSPSVRFSPNASSTDYITITFGRVYELGADGRRLPGRSVPSLAALSPELSQGTLDVNGSTVRYVRMSLPVSSLGAAFSVPCVGAPPVDPAGYVAINVIFDLANTTTFPYGPNETVTVPAGGTKFNLEASKWPFCSTDNQLMVELSIKSGVADALPLLVDTTGQDVDPAPATEDSWANTTDSVVDAEAPASDPANTPAGIAVGEPAPGSNPAPTPDDAPAPAPADAPAPTPARRRRHHARKLRALAPDGSVPPCDGDFCTTNIVDDTATNTTTTTPGAGGNADNKPTTTPAAGGAADNKPARPRRQRARGPPPGAKMATFLLSKTTAAALNFQTSAFDSAEGAVRYPVSVAMRAGEEGTTKVLLGFPYFETSLYYDPDVSTSDPETLGYTTEEAENTVTYTQPAPSPVPVEAEVPSPSPAMAPRSNSASGRAVHVALLLFGAASVLLA